MLFIFDVLRYANMNKQLFTCERVKHLYDSHSGSLESVVNTNVPEPMDISKDMVSQEPQGIYSEGFVVTCETHLYDDQ